MPELDEPIVVEPGQEPLPVDPVAPPEVEDEPAPTRFKLDDELEFDNQAQASQAFRTLAARLSDYENSHAVQAAREQELQARAEEQRQQDAILQVYSRTAAEAKAEIAAGNLDHGLARIMHGSVKVAEHNIAKALMPEVARMIQQALDLNNSPAELERAESLSHLRPYKNQMLALERRGWSRKDIVSFFEDIAQTAPKPAGRALGLEAPGGSAPLSKAQIEEDRRWAKVSKKFWDD